MKLPEKTSVCHCSGGSALMPVPEGGRSEDAPLYCGLPAHSVPCEEVKQPPRFARWPPPPPPPRSLLLLLLLDPQAARSTTAPTVAIVIRIAHLRIDDFTSRRQRRATSTISTIMSSTK